MYLFCWCECIYAHNEINSLSMMTICEKFHTYTKKEEKNCWGFFFAVWLRQINEEQKKWTANEEQESRIRHTQSRSTFFFSGNTIKRRQQQHKIEKFAENMLKFYGSRVWYPVSVSVSVSVYVYCTYVKPKNFIYKFFFLLHVLLFIFIFLVDFFIQVWIATVTWVLYYPSCLFSVLYTLVCTEIFIISIIFFFLWFVTTHTTRFDM